MRLYPDRQPLGARCALPFQNSPQTGETFRDALKEKQVFSAALAPQPEIYSTVKKVYPSNIRKCIRVVDKNRASR